MIAVDGSWEKLLCYAISNIFVLAFAYCFLERRFSKRTTLLVLALALITTTGLDYILFFLLDTSFSSGAYAITTLEVIIVQAAIFFLSSYRDGRGLFTGLVASNYVLPGFILGGFVYSSFDTFFPALLALIIIDTVVLVLLKRFVRQAYARIQARGNTGWFSLCLVPVFFYLLFYFLSVMPVSLAQDPKDYPAAIVALITMVVTYSVVMRYITQQSDAGVMEQQLALLDGYTRRLKRESEALLLEQEHLAIAKHDMRHYCSILSVMLAEKDLEGMSQVLDEVVSETDHDTITKFCDDPIINSALLAVSHQAKSHKVDLQTSIIIPEMPHDSRVRFSAIMVNLIENAIGAAAQVSGDHSSTLGKQVAVIIKPVKQQLFLEVSNPYRGTIILDPDEGLPRSSRGSDHGFGLKSVREFAELFGGVFDYEYDKQVFIARLTIPINEM